MTKQKWIEHIEEVTGMRYAPANPACKLDVQTHMRDNPDCPVCKARRATRRANENAKAIRQAYADCGMKRVRGALGGIYYE